MRQDDTPLHRMSGGAGADTGVPAPPEGLLDQARRERDEAHHRVANSLQCAVSLLRAQRQDVNSEEARFALLAAETRLDGVARIHRRLCDRETGRPVSLATFLGGLAADLGAGFGVAVEVACDPVPVPDETATQLAIVVSELVLNAIKHAGADGDRRPVRLEGRRCRDGLRMVVSDCGVGLPAGFSLDAAQGGLGMSIIAGAVQRIGGRISAHTDGGAVFVVKVPLA